MKPRLLVIAGPNGSGKTSITEQLYELRHQWMVGCDYINPDNIANQIGNWNDDVSVLKAAEAATLWRRGVWKKEKISLLKRYSRHPKNWNS